jgi:hydroxymethylpyrimidine/phosphomethylpyrimidine kinase
MVAIALSIAGSDPSGGAGIQADLKTFARHEVYGCAVPTLLTAQNTTSVRAVSVLTPELVAQQLDAVLEDITPGAAKTGALGSPAIVELVADRFARARIPLVVDPVRIAKHAASLLADEARDALLLRLLPVATLLTANADEAAWLTGRPVRDLDDALRAARALRERTPAAIMVKGGHLTGDDAVDLVLDDDGVHELRAPRIAARHTHGVGCTLSAAIAANLALGLPLLRACERAKRWLSLAIANSPGVGHGVGAVDHLAPLPPLDPDEPAR